MFLNYYKVISPKKLRKKIRLDRLCKKIKNSNDQIVKDIINGIDKRFLIVCGPCGADNSDAVLEFCERLKQLHLKVKDKIFLMPRIYTAKARSTGAGYLGMMFQPSGDKIDINKGLIESRKMIAKCIAKTGLPIAEDFVFIEQLNYFSDLISYYFLGARQSDSPLFRNVASGLDVAVGLKNNLAGNLNNLAGSLRAVRTSKTFLYQNLQVVTAGNQCCHGVLRGYEDTTDGYFSNINQSSIDYFREKCKEYDQSGDFLMIDCSHANSNKCAVNQIQNALDVINNTDARGIMMESYLFEGTATDKYGVSKTDECLDWDNTEKLIMQIYDLLIKKDK